MQLPNIDQESIHILFKQRFTLCYSHPPTSDNWNCEAGYKTQAAVDQRVVELRRTTPSIRTNVYTFNKLTPLLLQQGYVKADLLPNVSIQSVKKN